MVAHFFAYVTWAEYSTRKLCLVRIGLRCLKILVWPVALAVTSLRYKQQFQCGLELKTQNALLNFFEYKVHWGMKFVRDICNKEYSSSAFLRRPHKNLCYPPYGFDVDCTKFFVAFSEMLNFPTTEFWKDITYNAIMVKKLYLGSNKKNQYKLDLRSISTSLIHLACLDEGSLGG